MDASTMYGFMSVVISLFLANMCVIRRASDIYLLSRKKLTHNSDKRRSVSRESTQSEADMALYEFKRSPIGLLSSFDS